MDNGQASDISEAEFAIYVLSGGYFSDGRRFVGFCCRSAKSAKYIHVPEACVRLAYFSAGAYQCLQSMYAHVMVIINRFSADQSPIIYTHLYTENRARLSTSARCST